MVGRARFELATNWLKDSKDVVSIIFTWLRIHIESGFVGGSLIEAIRQQQGLFPGEALRNWLGECIANKLAGYFNGDRERAKLVTFKELAELAANDPTHRLKKLVVIGSNISALRPHEVRFSAENKESQNDLVLDAVRISMSVPGLFVPHQRYILKDNQRVPHPDGHLHIDGGVFNNYPADSFDDQPGITPELILGFRLSGDLNLIKIYETGRNLSDLQPIVTEGSEKDYSLPSILSKIGLYFLGSILMLTSPISAPFAGVVYSSLRVGDKAKQQLLQVIKAATFLAQQESIHGKNKSVQQRTVYIYTLDVTLFDFNLTTMQQDALIQEGERGVERFFARPMPDKQSFPFSTPVLIKVFKELLQKNLIPKEAWLKRGSGSETECFYFNSSLAKVCDLNWIGRCFALASMQEREYLFALGLNVHLRDARGRTILHALVAAAQVECVYKLLQTDVGRIALSSIDLAGDTVLDVAYQLFRGIESTPVQQYTRLVLITTFLELELVVCKARQALSIELELLLAQEQFSDILSADKIREWVGFLRMPQQAWAEEPPLAPSPPIIHRGQQFFPMEPPAAVLTVEVPEERLLTASWGYCCKYLFFAGAATVGIAAIAIAQSEDLQNRIRSFLG